MVYLAMLAFAITLQAVPPVLPLIIADLDVSHAQAGMLMSLFAVPGILVSIPAGLLADRYGQRLLGLFSFLCMAAGMAVFAVGHSFLVLSLGRVLAGMGAMTLLVITPQLLAQWFGGRELGLAMGIFNTGVPVGTIISFSALAALGEAVGWRATAWVPVALSGVVLLAFLALSSPAPGAVRASSGGLRACPVLDTGTAPTQKLGKVFRDIRGLGLPIWLLGVAWLCFNAAIISLFTFAPDFLKGRGLSVGYAGLVTGALMWPALLLSPLAGYVMDRWGGKELLMAGGGVGIAALVIVLPSAVPWVLGMMLLIGTAQALVPAPVFALAPDVVEPAKLGLGFGVVSTCLNVGIVAGPLLAGLARDATGSYGVSFGVIAAFAALVAVSALTLRWRRSVQRGPGLKPGL